MFASKVNIIRRLPRFREADAALAELSQRESWTRSEIESLQLERLNLLWRRATQSSPYYESLAGELRLPERFESLAEFQTLVPPLTKQIVRSQYQTLLTRDAKPGAWHYTSGSSGSPTPVYWSHGDKLRMLRTRYRFYQMWDVDFFDRWAFIWGNADAFAKGWSGWRARLLTPATDWLRNRIRLSPYDLSRTALRDQLNKLRKFQPAAIYAHSMAVYLLALEAERVGFDCPSLKLIVPTAEPAPAKLCRTMERVFDAASAIEYGSVECGFLAGQWPDGTLRVRDDNAIVETTARSDGRFDVLVTVLGNSAFPLLRYAIGDVAAGSLIRPSQGFAILPNVVGRDYDLLATMSGDLLHGQIFEDLLDKQRAIRRWRLLQDRNGAVTVLLECQSALPPSEQEHLVKQFQRLLKGFEVRISLVDQLPAGANGKHRTIASELASHLDRASSSQLADKSLGADSFASSQAVAPEASLPLSNLGESR